MKNFRATLLTQYAASPILGAILDNLNTNLDPTTLLRAFYDQIWNIATATGYGLDVWGRIVGISRNLQVATTYSYFGFEEATGVQPFNQAPFYNGEPVSGSTILTLSDDAYRRLILLKASANITNCSAQSLNALLAGLFGDQGACYVIDSGNMSFVFRFKFNLTAVDFTLLSQSGVLPRPAGVSYTIVQGP